VASLVVNTFPQAFLEVLHLSLQHVGRNCCQFFPDVLFQIHRCPWFLFVLLALEIFSDEGVSRLGTLVPVNIDLPTKYPLSQDRIVVFEIRLHSKSPMLYRPALHGNSNALSLARRALKDKFPTPTVPLTTVLQNRHVFLPDPVFPLRRQGEVMQRTFSDVTTSNHSSLRPFRMKAGSAAFTAFLPYSVSGSMRYRSRHCRSYYVFTCLI